MGWGNSAYSFALLVSEKDCKLAYRTNKRGVNMAEIEYAFVSLRVTTQEKEALKAAANKENRSLANYLLNAGLERANTSFGILPEYEDESVLSEEDKG